MDLLDLYRGELSLRKLSVLVMQLPAGAGIWQALGTNAAWTTEAHALVSVIDALMVVIWQRTKDGSKGRNRPAPLPRPEAVTERAREIERTYDRARAFKARQAAKAQARAAEEVADQLESTTRRGE